MHRIDGPGATPGNLFTEEDPVGGIDPTQHTADWNNAVQEELATFIEAQGIALNKADNTQLAAAITAVADRTQFRNLVQNGQFMIWGRGVNASTFPRAASGVPISNHCADRWLVHAGGGSGAVTCIRKLHAHPTPIVGSTHYLEFDQTAAGIASNKSGLLIDLESAETLGGRNAALSVWLHLTAGAIDVECSLVQHFGVGGSGDVITVLGTVTAASVWTLHKLPITAIPTVAGKTFGTPGTDRLTLQLRFDDAETFTLEVDQVQLEPERHTLFEIRPLAIELALCERFYESSYDDLTKPGAGQEENMLSMSRFNVASEPFSGNEPSEFGGLTRPFRAQKRVAPIVHFWNGSTVDEIEMWSVEVTEVDGAFTPASHTSRANIDSVGAPIFTTVGTLPNGGKTNLLRAHFTADAEFRAVF